MIAPPGDRRRLAQRERLKLPETYAARAVALMWALLLFVTAIVMLLVAFVRALWSKFKGEPK